jgi:hypothetical protein
MMVISALVYFASSRLNPMDPYGAPKSQMSIEIVVELLNKNLADSPYKDVILKSGRKISCVQFSINQQSRSCH